MARTYSRVALALALVALAGTVAAQETVVAGTDGVRAPKRRKTIQPEYPPEAAAEGMRGIVVLELIIAVDGTVDEVNVVRSVPPFDEAAIAAARQWEYERTTVDGRPVRVKLSVPITFMMKLPEITREEGIPELRQGAIPRVPPETEREAKVQAEITLMPEGQVAEAQILEGDSPWSDALIGALRTWRFDANLIGGDIVTFRAEARFVPESRGRESRVPIKLSDLRRQPAAEEPAQEPPARAGEAASDPEAQPDPQTRPADEAPEAAGEPPPPAPPTGPAEPPSAPEAAPPAEPGMAPVPEVEGEPSATQEHPTDPEAPAAAPNTPDGPAPEIETTPVESGPPELIEQPTTEVMTLAPSTTPPPPATRSDEPGVSSVQGVFLGAGLPDLTGGRRPVVPPFARMEAAVGAVTVGFAITPAGTTVVRSVEGAEIFQVAARQAVASWFFVRETADRLFATAQFSYETASVQVELDLNPR